MSIFTGLKQFVQNMAGYHASSIGSDCCAIGILPDQFYLAIRRGSGASQSELLVSYTYEPAYFAATLEKVVANHQLTDMACGWVLYPEQYQLFLMDELPVTADEFQSAIRWKLADMLSFPAEEAIIDYFHIPPHKTHHPQPMIMVAVSHLPFLERYTDVLVDAGLNLKAISIQELALTQFISLFESGERSSALIYLEERTGELLIARQKALYLQRSFSEGWGSMSTLLSSQGSKEGSCPSLEDLALEVQRSLDYYQTQWRHQIPEQILFATSLSAENSMKISASLVSFFSIPVVLLPLEKVFPETHVRWMHRQGRFLPVLGNLLSREVG